MRTLVISSRFPWPAFTGDRLRATVWIDALAATGEVTLIAPAGEVPPHAPAFEFIPVARSGARLLTASMQIVRRRLPFQTLLSAGYDWPAAIRAATASAPFDCSVVLLSRLDPSVRDHLPRSRHLLDAIDSLGKSMRERERHAGALLRPIWRVEAARTEQFERTLAQAYEQVVVVDAAEAGAFGRAAVVPMGVRVHELHDVPRRFDFGFWGRLRYFANRDAARSLLYDFWPIVRSQHPSATLVIGGAEAPRFVRAEDGRNGVTVISPVNDISSLARDVKVAVFPVRFGTGQSNKILEAAEGGCAIAAFPLALRGFDDVQAEAVAAEEGAALGRAAAALLADREALVKKAAGLRRIVQTRHNRSETCEQLVRLAGGAS